MIETPNIGRNWMNCLINSSKFGNVLCISIANIIIPECDDDIVKISEDFHCIVRESVEEILISTDASIKIWKTPVFNIVKNFNNLTFFLIFEMDINNVRGYLFGLLDCYWGIILTELVSRVRNILEWSVHPWAHALVGDKLAFLVINSLKGWSIETLS